MNTTIAHVHDALMYVILQSASNGRVVATCRAWKAAMTPTLMTKVAIGQYGIHKALTKLAASGRNECVRIILDKMKPTVQDEQAVIAATCYAIVKGHTDTVRMMREWQKLNNYTAQHVYFVNAITFNRLDILEELIDEWIALPSMTKTVQNRDFLTFVHVAVENNKPDALQWMLKWFESRNMDVTNPYTNTLLTMRTINIHNEVGRAKCANLVLKHIMKKRPIEAFTYSARAGDLEVFSELLSLEIPNLHKMYRRALAEAVRFGHIAIINKLYKLSTPPNDEDARLLEEAAVIGKVDVVLEMLEHNTYTAPQLHHVFVSACAQQQHKVVNILRYLV